MKENTHANKSKYTPELLNSVVSKSRTNYDVLRKLNLSVLSGSNHTYIKSLIKRYNIDISHFVGIRANSGIFHVGGTKKIPYQEILIYNKRNGQKEGTYVLKRAMTESGIKEKCDVCGLENLWLKKD